MKGCTEDTNRDVNGAANIGRYGLEMLRNEPFPPHMINESDPRPRIPRWP